MRELSSTAVGVEKRGVSVPGWQMAPPLPEPLGEITGAVVNGKWYVIGGLDTKHIVPWELCMCLIHAMDSGRESGLCPCRRTM